MRDKIWMRRRRRSLSFQRKLLLHEKLKGEKGSLVLEAKDKP